MILLQVRSGGADLQHRYALWRPLCVYLCAMHIVAEQAQSQGSDQAVSQ